MENERKSEVGALGSARMRPRTLEKRSGRPGEAVTFDSWLRNAIEQGPVELRSSCSDWPELRANLARARHRETTKAPLLEVSAIGSTVSDTAAEIDAAIEARCRRSVLRTICSSTRSAVRSQRDALLARAVEDRVLVAGGSLAEASN